jgi:HPt (histidine-containing phosphotransfer) domain-containing protein
MSPTTLDLAVIQDLVDVDGTGDFLREVGALFVSKGAENVAAIEKLLADGNRAEAARVAHKLKSSGGNFGAADFAAACLAIEHMPAETAPNETQRLLTRLRAEYDTARAAVLAEMAKAR